MSAPTLIRLVTLSAFAAVGLLVSAWGDDKARGKSYALLVGVTEYDSKNFSALKYTANDVNEMAKALKKAGFASVRVLADKRGKQDAPTAENFRAALKELLAKKTKHDTVLVGLAGHGMQLEVRDKDDLNPKSYTYFCPKDASLQDISYSTGRSDQLILLDELFKQLGECDAGHRLTLIDACRTDGSVKAGKRDRLDVNKVTVPDGVGVLFSCGRRQFAFETPDLGKGHGVFFYHVIEGLNSKAKDDEGAVTWDGLAAYVKRQVPRYVEKHFGKQGARQTPASFGNLEGETLLTRSVPGDKTKTPRPKTPRLKASQLTHVVLVGVGQYADKAIPPRVHAEADARALAKLFENADHADADVTLLLGKEATKEAFLKALADVAKDARESDTVVIGFVGQGCLTKSGRGYLLADSEAKSADKTAASSAEIAQALRPLKARQVCALIDVDFTAHVVADVDRTLGTAPYFEFLGSEGSDNVPLPGRVAFLATNGLSRSLDLRDGGLFATVVLDALKGTADTEGYEADGLVSTHELATHLNTHLPKLAEKHGKTDDEKTQAHYGLSGRKSHYVLTKNPKAFATSAKRLKTFDEIATKEKLSLDQMKEGFALLERMPRLKWQQELRKAYQDLVDGKTGAARFALARQEIFDGKVLPDAEATVFAENVNEAIRIVGRDYVKETDAGELAALAVRELFDAADEDVPAAIEAQLKAAKGLAADKRAALLADARKALGRRETFDNFGDLSAALKMLRRLDKDSFFMMPQQSKKNTEDLAGSLVGIGATLRKDARTGHVQITTPIFGGPAYKEKLYAGDLITEIARDADGKKVATKTLTLEGAIAHIRGKSGTKLTLVVQRPGSDKPIEFTLTRASFNFESAYGARRKADDSWDFTIDPQSKIAYVRPAGFPQTLVGDLKALMPKLIKEGLKGFVLDLRFNSGGYLDDAIALADLFIDDGVIVTIRGRGKEEAVHRGNRADSLLSFPMVCLVNGSMGAGPEFIAAALQDHQRALIVGERSLGAAHVRRTRDYTVKNPKSKETLETKLMLMTGTLVRPNGKNLCKALTKGGEADEWGVVPDKTVKLTTQQRRDLDAHHLRLEAIEHPDRRAKAAKEVEAFKDKQLDAAVEYLRGQIKLAEKK